MELPAPAEAEASLNNSDVPAEPPFGVVGYLLSDKKRRSLLTADFLQRARLRGLRFVPVDPHRPLDEQEGHPFDVILHKLPSSSPDIQDWEARLGAYMRSNPWVSIVDTPQAARQARALSNRATMLLSVEGINLGEAIGTSVAVPRQVVVDGEVEEVAAALRASGLGFPLLAKSLLADGSESSHALALVHDEHGLHRLASGDVPGLRPPCVLQEFVDHGGSLFKVYVVGDAVTTARRRSLPDQRGYVEGGVEGGDALVPGGGASLARVGSNGHVIGGLEAVDRISTLGVHWRGQAALDGDAEGGDALAGSGLASPPRQLSGIDAATPPGYIVEGAESVLEPSAAFVHALAMSLQASLGLQLFNFDLIRVNGEQDRFVVVDINYFPGIAKMPGYELVFCDFLRKAVDASWRKREASLREGPEAAPDAPSPAPTIPAVPSPAPSLPPCSAVQVA